MLVQSGLIIAVLAIGMQMPRTGIVLPAAIELYVTIVLAGFAGISLGLVLSAFAATPYKAMSLIPLVLVPQVLFAGVMFVLSGATALIGWLVSSRAAVDALSAIVDLNNLPSPVPMPYVPAHVHTARVLVVAWVALAAQAAVFGAAARWKLRK